MKYLLLCLCAIILSTSLTFSQWIPQNSNTGQRLLTSFFLNENLGWAGGNEGCIMKTTDGGTNWSYISIGTKYTVHSVYFVDSLKGWAALYTFNPSRGGYIAATTDGGLNWYFQHYADDHTLHRVYFYDQYLGWVVGSNGIFLRTYNGGGTWQEYSFSPNWSWSLEFINPNIGWVGEGFAGYIRKTTDGGSTWQFKSVPSNSAMFDIDFINVNTGWAVGQYGHILKTTNQGESWNHQSCPVSMDLNDVAFINANEGWIVGNGGIILHTTNGGINWFPQISNTSNNLFAVSIHNQNIGWAAGNSGVILKTENGGGPLIPVELTSFSGNCESGKVILNWTTATEINNLGFEIERRSQNSEWLLIGFEEGNGTTTDPQEYFYVDDLSGFTFTNVYYRLKQRDYNGNFEYSGEIKVSITPAEFELKQNYPNPFNPVTTIQYVLPLKDQVIIKVYDILGNEIETLVQQIQEPGYHQIIFDAGNLASGIYYYSISAGSYFEIKKMMLLK